MKIILLEDTVELNKGITKILTDESHEVISCFDGECVIDYVSSDIGVYILDIHVPGISGIELLKEIKRFDKQAKIVLISAHRDRKTIEQAYKYGCKQYIKKPFENFEIALIVKQIMDDENDIMGDVKLKKSITKSEQILLKLLKKNEDKVVKYDDIHENVYNNSKEINLVAIRTLVRRLRVKIENYSVMNAAGVGYILKKG